MKTGVSVLLIVGMTLLEKIQKTIRLGRVVTNLIMALIGLPNGIRRVNAITIPAKIAALWKRN